MKTKIFKISMPIAIFALAIAGAFASQKSDSKTVAPQTGWIDAPSPCKIQVSCSDVLGPVCTMFHQGQNKQAYGKVNPSDATCAKVLYRAQ